MRSWLPRRFSAQVQSRQDHGDNDLSVGIGRSRKGSDEMLEIPAQDQGALAKLAHRQTTFLDEAIKRGTTNPERAGGLGNGQC